MAEGVAVFFEEHRESKDLGRRALRGGIVSVAMQYGNGAFQIVSAIVLARLLAPEDFGLVAIVGFDELRTVADRFWSRRRNNTKKQNNAGPGQHPLLAQQRDWIDGCGGRGYLQPSDCIGLPRASAGAYRPVYCSHLRIVRHIKSASGAFTTCHAVWHNRQNTASQHSNRNCHCGHFRGRRIWLLGARAASNCELALRCSRSLVCMPVETRISCP